MLVEPSPAPSSGRGDSGFKGRVASDRWGSVSERLVYLFETRVPPGRTRPWSPAEVSAAVRERGGQISAIYLQKLLTGERTDPTARYLRPLAEFFGVRLSWFYAEPDEELGAEESGQTVTLADVSALADPGVRQVVRSFVALSPPSRLAVQELIQAALRAEGKTAAGHNSLGD
jgi:transcriptional regulator with XRE-family HTH domain